MREIGIPRANGDKIGGRFEADDLVGDLAEFVASGLGGDGNGNNDASGVLWAESADGGLHGGAGGKAVVNQDNGAIANIKRRALATVFKLAALNFGGFALGDGFDDGRSDVEAQDDVVVENAYTPAGDGSHGELLTAGDAELADDEDVEGEAKPSSDFGGDRDTSAREGEDEISATRFQLLREEEAGVRTIAKNHNRSLRARLGGDYRERELVVVAAFTGGGAVSGSGSGFSRPRFLRKVASTCSRMSALSRRNWRAFSRP